MPLLALVALIAWYHEGLKPAFDSGSKSEFALLASIVLALGILLVVLALPAIWTGTHIARLARVAVNHSSYQAIIAEARQSGDEQWYAEAHGIIYNVDLGPPVRVAFHPSGFLDNWSAIVFDPTGDVMLADGFDSKTGEFAAPDRVTKLFHGDLVSCRPLWNDYYSCGFT